MSNRDIELLQLLADRLERLSADSLWARRASGLRGNILKVLEEYNSHGEIETNRAAPLIQRSFEILKHAGREIPDSEEITKKNRPTN